MKLSDYEVLISALEKLKFPVKEMNFSDLEKALRRIERALKYREVLIYDIR